jgi:hypothetical protein
MIDAFFLDTETIPCPILPEGIIEAAKEKAKAARSVANKDYNKHLATDPDTAMICCAVGFDSASGQWFNFFAKDLESERKILMVLWEVLIQNWKVGRPLCTFNGKSFDVQLLQRRAMWQRVPISVKCANDLQNTRSDVLHIDLMLLEGVRTPFSSRPEFRGQDYMSTLIGCPPKPEGWDGSKVWPAFQAGMFEDIREYCKSDVRTMVDHFNFFAPWMLDFSLYPDSVQRSGEIIVRGEYDDFVGKIMPESEGGQ